MKEQLAWAKDPAEREAVVNYLQIILKDGYQHLANPVIKKLALEKLREHEILDAEGNYHIPVQLWLLVNSDMKYGETVNL